MSEQMYRQCEIEHSDGSVVRVTWLPAVFARVGARLRIGVQHWVVVRAYKTPVTMEFLGHVRDAQKQRESTVR